MRQLTTYERRRHRIRAIRKAAIEFLVVAAATAAWVLVMDQLLKAKGL